MKSLLIATGNEGKLKEMREIFGNLPMKLLGLKDVGLNADAPETGSTFHENAALKAQYYFEKAGGEFMVLAEDSGVLVDALPGQLGVYTRRWGAGESATDFEWLEYFLQVMNDVPHEKRTATFHCVAVLYLGAKISTPENLKIFEGKTEGIITFQPESKLEAGIPLSACFKPIGFEKVYSAMTVEEKNLVSHRGKAMRMVEQWVISLDLL